MARRKALREEAEITVWPSSFPEGVGSNEPHGSGESLDSDELGSHFMTDNVEHNHGMQSDAHWNDEVDDEPYFDARRAAEILRSFGLKPMPKRTTTRPIANATVPRLPKMAQPRLPRDLDEFIGPSNDVDLTGESICDASLLDREGEEEGEVESPSLITEDVHTHGKRRGGHARTSLRPPARK